MTTFDIKFNNNTANTTNNGNIYSKMLDDIILDTVMKNNSYLLNKTKKEKEATLIDAMFADIDHATYIDKSLKGDDLFTKACKILAGYNKKKAKGITLGKIYRLSDGTAIIFYDDEIQIGTDLYSYADFNNFDFISGLTPEKKKIIIEINIKL